jgi:hypothetical protein
MNYDMAMMPRLIEFLDQQPEYHAYVTRLHSLGWDDAAIATTLTELTVQTIRKVSANRIN